LSLYVSSDSVVTTESNVDTKGLNISTPRSSYLAKALESHTSQSFTALKLEEGGFAGILVKLVVRESAKVSLGEYTQHLFSHF
jgi:hypothetical protein